MHKWEEQEKGKILLDQEMGLLQCKTYIYFLEETMLRWAVIFLVIALIAGVLGLGGVAGVAAEIAKVLFVIFLVLFIISLVLGYLPKG